MLIGVMAEESYRRETKLALTKVDSKAMVVKALEKLLKVFVLLLSRAADVDNVKIDEHEVETTIHPCP